MKSKLLTPVLFVLSFITIYLFICFGIPGMRIKLEAEPLELFIKSVEHMSLFKSLISSFVGIVVVLWINHNIKKK